MGYNFHTNITYFNTRLSLIFIPISLIFITDITYVHSRYHSLSCWISLTVILVSLIFIIDITYFHNQYHLRDGETASFRFLLLMLLLRKACSYFGNPRQRIFADTR
jgi:hypothetical protein